MNAIPWPEFRSELLKLYEKPLRAPATHRAMRAVLTLAETEAAITTTAEFTTPAVARYVASRPPGLAPRTLAKELRYLRAAANYALSAGYLARSPFDARPVRSWIRLGPPAPKLWYPPEAVRNVLDLMAQDIRETAGWAQWRARRMLALTATVAYCGLRKSEALWLHADDVSIEARTIRLIDRGRNGKALKTSAAAQPVPIPAAAVPILADWREHRLDHPADFPIPGDCPWWIPNLNRCGGPWSSGSPGTKPIDRLQQVAARAGYPGMTFQSLRASWATRAESAGMSALLIQRVLRHTNTQTQTWYRGNDLPALVEAVAGFDF